MKKCPFCAEEIQDEAIMCKHCGSDLQNRKVGRGYTSGVSLGTRLAKIVFMGGFVMVILIIATIINKQISKNTEPEGQNNKNTVMLNLFKKDNVSVVKSGYMELDKGVSVGNAFDNYKYFSEVKWNTFTTSNGREIVEVNGIIDLKGIACEDVINEMVKIATGGFAGEFSNTEKQRAVDELREKIDSLIKSIIIVYQFSLNNDDTFQASYGGYEITKVRDDTPTKESFGDKQLLNLRAIYNEQPPPSLVAILIAIMVN